jgi:lysozyme
MNYTSERIYGIDISRYQHGKGRKKYPILWDRLRISHLGSKSKKKISGTVDYPVQFCFIKSTEGTSIRNKYFLKDYQGAKKHGIHTGAYHFYSCKSSGSAQAAYFINSTLFRQGDLPPVLDIEPSDRDIARYGGTDALFRNIRAWLQAVEQRTKVKPILYVNQRFVNKYLPDAPDIKRDYKVWIARYGEYKPDVKLVIWQLSPDGRVQGITGEVDINVFNGYQQQFDEFIANETIK